MRLAVQRASAGGAVPRLADLRASRARVVAPATPRRPLERDLHDGAQQRLIALFFELRLALAAADGEAARLLAEATEADRRRSPTCARSPTASSRRSCPRPGSLPRCVPLAAERPLPVVLVEVTSARLGRRRDRRLRCRRRRVADAARRGAMTVEVAAVRARADLVMDVTATLRALPPCGMSPTGWGRSAAGLVSAREPLKRCCRAGSRRRRRDAHPRGHRPAARRRRCRGRRRPRTRTRCSVRAAREPDAAIVDIRMPPTHTDEGLVAAQRIRASIRTSACLCSPSTSSRLRAATARGASEGVGYLLKDRVFDGASSSTRCVGCRRRTVVDPTIVSRLLAPTPRTTRSELTQREHEVLALVAEGCPTGPSPPGSPSPSARWRPTPRRCSPSSAWTPTPAPTGACAPCSHTCALRRSDLRLATYARSRRPGRAPMCARAVAGKLLGVHERRTTCEGPSGMRRRDWAPHLSCCCCGPPRQPPTGR